jgi:excisionase family DNA binding protein
MPTTFETIIDESDTDDLLTTGEVAKLLGVSRQHVVDLCDRGDLAYVMVGSHRRIRRIDAERARQMRTKMTRDQRRSLWLAYAVAGRLVGDPETGIALARNQLAHSAMRENKWTREWAELLDGDVDKVLGALTSTSQRSRELRQNSPFSGVLSEQDRAMVLAAFSRVGRAHATD